MWLMHCCPINAPSNSAHVPLTPAWWIQVLSNVASQTAKIHAAGYVHRDLKPGNVMWLPRENRWTVIDFGCAARIGEIAPLSFTLAYAPPEAAVALAKGATMMQCETTHDSWSLGVIAFELLTGRPAYAPLTHGSDTVCLRTFSNPLLPLYPAPAAQMLRTACCSAAPSVVLTRSCSEYVCMPCAPDPALCMRAMRCGRLACTCPNPPLRRCRFLRSCWERVPCRGRLKALQHSSNTSEH
jgi:serine/threonine protein kinase